VKRELLNGIVNRINLVGIELEGGWDKAVQGYEIIRDGSVKFDPPQGRYDYNPRTGEREFVLTGGKTAPKYAVGEIVSGRTGMKIAAIEPWLTRCYPQHVNETCGLHVHMSFTNKLNYSRLMSQEYLDQMIRELRLWGEREGITDKRFWNRLDPNHPWTQQHCAHLFLGDKQALIRKKDYNSRGTSHSRYTFINFCEAQHHTVEVRGLTMFEDSATAYKAIMCVLDTTNRFLSKIRQRERKVAVSIQERPVSYEEIGTVVV